MPKTSVKGLILMGGQSSRMGEDKAFVLWQGKTLLQHAIDHLQQVVPDTYLSVNHQQYKQLKDTHQCIPDKYIDKGPLGGILSAFEVLKTDLLVLAVDMPMVTNNMLQVLVTESNNDTIKAYRDNKTNDWVPLPSFWPIVLSETIATFCSPSGSMNIKSPSLKKILEAYGTGVKVTLSEECVLNVNRPTDLR